MKELRNIVLILCLFYGATGFSGSSMFDRRIKSGENLYEALLRQQMPEDAVDLLFRMFDYN